MLDNASCRQRQKRLLTAIGSTADAVVLGSPQNVYYFSGHLADWRKESACVIFADGRSVLMAAHRAPEGMAVDDTRSYESNWNATLRQEQAMAAAAQLVEIIHDGGAKRIAVDGSAVVSQLLLANLYKAVPVDQAIYKLRRVKDADELALMQTAISATEAMHARAREIIVPGVSEIDVFNELSAASVRSLGEPMSELLGNDFACGAGGGPPRKDRVAKAGEIYLLDLGPQYRGYYADNCRGTVVGGKATDEQMKAWKGIVDALSLVESIAKPGVRCQAIYEAVDAHFMQVFGKPQVHHLGHGVGLSPHEFPHLNPKWDDTLLEGEVFTAEPGVYNAGLRGGIRLENQYVVTKTGVKNLLNYPLAL
ncbi:aminopeptidase P family protein [soil metagenome]